MNTHTVLLFEKMDPRGIEYLRQHADVRFAERLDEEALLGQVGDVDGIIVRANGAVTRRLIAAAPRLIVVGRHGVGLETIDIEAATEHGVYVVNTPDATTEAVAEHTLAMMLNLSRWMLRADRALRAGHWGARNELIGTELLGRTIGIIGMGRIGRRVAELAHAFGMAVLYCDVSPAPEQERALGASRVCLDELLSAADVVTLHVPMTAETRRLLCRDELARMKPGAALINVSRGGVVDEAALIEALRSGALAGAGLDVYENEPLPADSPLRAMENVVLTPHMASHTGESMYRMAMVAEDVVAVLQGRRPRCAVNSPMGKEGERR